MVKPFSTILRFVPAELKISVKKIKYFGRTFFCPVCNSSLKRFLHAGSRHNAKCPVCGAKERHRTVWLYFINKTDLFSLNRKKMLHIAPERCFVSQLCRHPGIDYLTADLFSPAMVKMDITDIQYPDNSFDVIYCSHVLEHVSDDRKAMRELARILRPSGFAVLQVPIMSEKTFEDPSITDCNERKLLFGQEDHVRAYGLDYKDRLEESGFSVQVIPYLEEFSPDMLVRYGLAIEKDDIYLCRKR